MVFIYGWICIQLSWLLIIYSKKPRWFQKIHTKLQFVVTINKVLICTLTFKIDFTVAVGVKDVDDTLHKRVLLQFRQRHKLIDAQRSRLVKIELFESLPESFYLLYINCKLLNNHTAWHSGVAPHKIYCCDLWHTLTKQLSWLQKCNAT